MGLKSSIEKLAELITPVSATTGLDVADNRAHLRSGDPSRIRDGLRFLAEIGPAARDARPDVEALLDHHEPEIAALATRALAAIDRT